MNHHSASRTATRNWKLKQARPDKPAGWVAAPHRSPPVQIASQRLEERPVCLSLFAAPTNSPLARKRTITQRHSPRRRRTPSLARVTELLDRAGGRLGQIGDDLDALRPILLGDPIFRHVILDRLEIESVAGPNDQKGAGALAESKRWPKVGLEGCIFPRTADGALVVALIRRSLEIAIIRTVALTNRICSRLNFSSVPSPRQLLSDGNTWRSISPA
jgi:hypothetical protein